LAVEVLAPDETVADYEEKIAEYLSWGVRLIWLVDPNTQTVTVVRANGERQVLRGNDVLSGEDVVPSFKIRVKKIFE
jgi:Uma2 family endonuclease